MTNYTIQYSETENKAMEFIAADVDGWIQNAAHERARRAIDEIVQIAIQKFLEVGQSIPGSKDEIVAAAFANGWVKTAQERNEEAKSVLPK
jgi:hypothetical protein